MYHVVVRTDRLFKWIRVRLGFITVARPTGKRKIVNMRGLVFVGHCFFEARYGLRREGCKLQGLIRSGMTSRWAACKNGSMVEWKIDRAHQIVMGFLQMSMMCFRSMRTSLLGLVEILLLGSIARFNN